MFSTSYIQRGEWTYNALYVWTIMLYMNCTGSQWRSSFTTSVMWLWWDTVVITCATGFWTHCRSCYSHNIQSYHYQSLTHYINYLYTEILKCGIKDSSTCLGKINISVHHIQRPWTFICPHHKCLQNYVISNTFTEIFNISYIIRHQ